MTLVRNLVLSDARKESLNSWLTCANVSKLSWCQPLLCCACSCLKLHFILTSTILVGHSIAILQDTEKITRHWNRNWSARHYWMLVSLHQDWRYPLSLVIAILNSTTVYLDRCWEGRQAVTSGDIGRKYAPDCLMQLHCPCSKRPGLLQDDRLCIWNADHFVQGCWSGRAFRSHSGDWKAIVWIVRFEISGTAIASIVALLPLDFVTCGTTAGGWAAPLLMKLLLLIWRRRYCNTTRRCLLNLAAIGLFAKTAAE